jgi:hypothetical protein
MNELSAYLHHGSRGAFDEMHILGGWQKRHTGPEFLQSNSMVEPQSGQSPRQVLMFKIRD